MHKKIVLLLFLSSFLCLLSSCIRLTGTAGYWKKNADEETQGKSVTLDSDDLLYPNRTKGSITT